MSNQVYVVSAPSGTGKTTLNRRLIAEHPDVEMSVSYTARPKRSGETDGVDYHFISPDEFRKLIAEGKMLEHAEVFGVHYGTALKEIERIQAAGKKVLLEVDVQGWGQARPKLGDLAHAIFILPPSIAELWRRLVLRDTEPLGVRFRRLMTAKMEIECGPLYDTFIVNDDVERAYAELQSTIIKGEKSGLGEAQGRQHCQQLLDEFAGADWLHKLSQELTDKNGES